MKKILFICAFCLLFARSAIGTDNVFVWIYNESSNDVTFSVLYYPGSCTCNSNQEQYNCITGGPSVTVAPNSYAYWITLSPNCYSGCGDVTVFVNTGVNGVEDQSVGLLDPVIGSLYGASCGVEAVGLNCISTLGHDASGYSLALTVTDS